MNFSQTGQSNVFDLPRSSVLFVSRFLIAIITPLKFVNKFYNEIQLLSIGEVNVKRILILFMLFFLLCGCSNELISDDYVPEQTASTEALMQEKTEFRGIWVAIYEAAPENNSETDYNAKADKMMRNISAFGFTDVFLQVRANCDAIYKSDIFPACYMYACGGEIYFDALDIMCEKAHEYGLKIHAWINPYRICSDSKTQPMNIPHNINKSDIYHNGNAAYLNPCSDRVSELILDGIREICENYNIDGIHIDDYFFPSQDKEIDSSEYSGYIGEGGEMCLDDFRRTKVSSLISSAYSMIKFISEDIVFSISPAADIVKNKDKLYADVEKWSTESGYCDIIIPQIYFGFENTAQPFAETFEKWRILTENTDTKLAIGLAIYKSGTDDKYAGSGKNEWIDNNDIIKRQVELIRSCGAYGFSVFSYNYIFGHRNFTKEEVKKLKSVL